MRIRIAAAAAAVFVLAWIQFSALEPRRETGVLQTNPPTPFLHYSTPATPLGRALVVHGLDVSKELMQIFSAALVDGGFEVYAIDLPGHGDSPVGFDATVAGQTILNVLERIGGDSIVVGHSLGGGLLLDLSANHHFSTMVLLSPAPTPTSKIDAGRVLLVAGAFDLPPITASIPILADLGPPNVQSITVAGGGHGSPVFNPIAIRSVVEWLGGDGAKTKTTARLALILVMFISGTVLGVSLMPGKTIKTLSLDIPTTLVRYVAASGVALVILRFIVPLAWLRLYATDYLVSFVLLTGLALWIQQRSSLRINPTALLKATAAAVFVIVVLGFITASHVLHISLSDGRWWRFPCIALAGLPLFLFDEFTVRRIHPQWKSAAIAITTRLVLWAFMLTGVLILNRQHAFLVLIAGLMVVFWIALWFATGVVHRHTQDPLAAALFAMLIQGWAYAAWFVMK